jgi:hypothetical protein
VDLDGPSGMSGAEPVRRKVCLSQSQRTAASAKPDRPVRKRGDVRHAPIAGDGDEVRAAPSKSEARVTGPSVEKAGIRNLRKSR